MEKKGILQSQKTSQLICQGGEGRESLGCKQTRMSRGEMLIQNESAATVSITANNKQWGVLTALPQCQNSMQQEFLAAGNPSSAPSFPSVS